MAKFYEGTFSKGLRILTAALFLISTFAGQANAVPTFSAGSGYVMPEKVTRLTVDTFSLPDHLGTVKYFYQGSSNKIVVHIQDAHCNFAAQKIVSKIMGYLSDEYKMKSINLEGGVGAYDLGIFTSIYNRKVRLTVADYFTEWGEVNGAELFAINNPQKADLWGVENTGLYMKNLNVYRDSLEYKGTAVKYLDELDHVLSSLKASIFNNQLLEMDAEYSSYKAGKLEFKDYLVFLIGQARLNSISIKGYPNIFLLNQTIEEEGKIDFKKANTQRDIIIDRLEKVLSNREMSALVSKTLQFQNKILPKHVYYDYLIRKARECNVEMDEYPEFQKYIVYIAIYKAVDKMEVMREMTRLESDIKNIMFENGTQRELDVLSKNLVLTKNIFNIEFTKEDYRYYKENRKAFGMGNYFSFIEKEAPQYSLRVKLDSGIKEVDGYRDRIFKFYEYSFQRDDAFLENMKFENVAGTGVQGAILMTGGFHTENLCELFKENDISYVSIIPNFKMPKDYESPYFSILSGKSMGPVEKALDTSLSLIQVASLLNQLGVVADSERRKELFDLGVLAVKRMVARGEEGFMAFDLATGGVLVFGLQNGAPVIRVVDESELSEMGVTDEARLEAAIDPTNADDVMRAIAEVAIDKDIRDAKKREFMDAASPIYMDAMMKIFDVNERPTAAEIEALENTYPKLYELYILLGSMTGVREYETGREGTRLQLVEGLAAAHAGQAIYIPMGASQEQQVEMLLHELIAGDISGGVIDGKNVTSDRVAREAVRTLLSGDADALQRVNEMLENAVPYGTHVAFMTEEQRRMAKGRDHAEIDEAATQVMTAQPSLKIVKMEQDFLDEAATQVMKAEPAEGLRAEQVDPEGSTQQISRGGLAIKSMPGQEGVGVPSSEEIMRHMSGVEDADAQFMQRAESLIVERGSNPVKNDPNAMEVDVHFHDGTKVEKKKLVVHFDKVIGKGGSSTAYEATDADGNKFVFKRIRLDGSDEMNLTKKLDLLKSYELVQHQMDNGHDQVLEIYDVGRTTLQKEAPDGTILDSEEYYYLIEEFSTRSMTIKDFLRGRKNLTEGEKRLLTGGIVDAIMKTNDMGVIHADIKPDNIMVEMDSSGRVEGVKLFDWDTSVYSPVISNGKVVGVADAVQEGQLKLSLNMVAPNYWSITSDGVNIERGNEMGIISGEGDIYAAAYTIFFLLTGERPFDVYSEVEFAKNVVAGLESGREEFLTQYYGRYRGAKLAALKDRYPEGTIENIMLRVLAVEIGVEGLDPINNADEFLDAVDSYYSGVDEKILQNQAKAGGVDNVDIKGMEDVATMETRASSNGTAVIREAEARLDEKAKAVEKKWAKEYSWKAIIGDAMEMDGFIQEEMRNFNADLGRFGMDLAAIEQVRQKAVKKLGNLSAQLEDKQSDLELKIRKASLEAWPALQSELNDEYSAAKGALDRALVKVNKDAGMANNMVVARGAVNKKESTRILVEPKDSPTPRAFFVGRDVAGTIEDQTVAVKLKSKISTKSPDERRAEELAKMTSGAGFIGELFDRNGELIEDGDFSVSEASGKLTIEHKSMRDAVQIGVAGELTPDQREDVSSVLGSLLGNNTRTLLTNDETLEIVRLKELLGDKDVVNRVVALQADERVMGYMSSDGTLYLNQSLLTADNPLALLHELGEGFVTLPEGAEGLTRHTYMRGIGKDARLAYNAMVSELGQDAVDRMVRVRDSATDPQQVIDGFIEALNKKTKETALRALTLSEKVLIEHNFNVDRKEGVRSAAGTRALLFGMQDLVDPSGNMALSWDIQKMLETLRKDTLNVVLTKSSNLDTMSTQEGWGQKGARKYRKIGVTVRSSHYDGDVVGEIKNAFKLIESEKNADKMGKIYVDCVTAEDLKTVTEYKQELERLATEEGDELSAKRAANLVIGNDGATEKTRNADSIMVNELGVIAAANLILNRKRMVDDFKISPDSEMMVGLTRELLSGLQSWGFLSDDHNFNSMNSGELEAFMQRIYSGSELLRITRVDWAEFTEWNNAQEEVYRSL